MHLDCEVRLKSVVWLAKWYSVKVCLKQEATWDTRSWCGLETVEMCYLKVQGCWPVLTKPLLHLSRHCIEVAESRGTITWSPSTWMKQCHFRGKNKKAAADNSSSQYKAGCRTCHRDAFLSTLLLTLFLQSLFTQSSAMSMKGSKACQRTNSQTHTLAFCCNVNCRIVRLFGEINKTSLPFSCKPLRPVWTPSPSLQSNVPVNRLPTGHLLGGQETTATPLLLHTPHDLAFFVGCFWVTPT